MLLRRTGGASLRYSHCRSVSSPTNAANSGRGSDRDSWTVGTLDIKRTPPGENSDPRPAAEH